ncbi:EamA family transporter [Microbacterium protaetiae]|uniref:EamA family transporter n=2 Tax=Microbacterium protaetiae TaxID=2509458 RepID=A0A4P6EKD3_9MICO|nr:EamA family transporter [Microbacterium protaetiae]
MDAGAAIAVLVFPRVGPLGMVMLRLVFSALILLALTRPRLRGHGRDDWLSVLGYGVVLATMNSLFYLALERLPLGVTVTIEVLGPLVLSIVASRRASAWLWAVIAFAGVLCLGGGGWDAIDPLGVVFALGAAASWAFYILAAARVGQRFAKLDGLAIAMSIGALLSLPFGIVAAGAALVRPEVLGLGAAVALLSSTIPYALELIALRRLPASAFAILMSISPATAVLAGFVLLGQRLTALELVGIALVVAAGVGAVRAGVAEAGARHPSADASTGPLATPGALVADPTGPLAALNGPLTGPIEMLQPPDEPEEPFAQPLA